MSLGRCVLWVGVSLVLHAALFAALVHRVAAVVSDKPAELWMELAAPAVAEPAPVAEPPPTVEPPEPPRVAQPPARKERVARAAKSSEPQPPAAPEVTAPVVDGPSGVSVTPGDGAHAIGSTGAASDGTGRAIAGGGTGGGTGGGAGEAERTAGPAQLSLWLELAQLERLALSRPTIALLMAVPGYTDLWRGSGVRPLADLQRVRVRMMGLAPERLLVAGVHLQGADAIASAAQRVAAMRDQAPVWRGDGDFRATSWVDGSATDRGLAVHGGAFVIAERKALPLLLGSTATEASVQAVSRVRDHVVTLITIEDAPRYLPRVDACALQALRISFADNGESPRMTLAAHYKTATLASEARACLQRLEPELGAQLPTILSWLVRAQLGEGSASAQLSMGVTSNDIEKLFNELAWALRAARRA